MKNTRSIGIRLPVELWDLVKAAEPDKHYGEIVRCALEDKYCFSEIDLDGSILKPESNKISHLEISEIIDNWG